jgi:hypothetical protein
VREIMRDNEWNSETEKNRFEECHVISGVTPEKGHLTPEIKIANEIICDHVWDLISVTCSKWYIRKALFILGVQPLDLSPLSHCQLA